MRVQLVIIIIYRISDTMILEAIRMPEIISYLNMDLIKAAEDSHTDLKSISRKAISFLKLMREQMKMLI
jgi:hypothetical protein